MNPAARQIVVLGAPGTGAPELRAQLALALQHEPGLELSCDELPGRSHDFALLMGLDLPVKDLAQRGAQESLDAQLREQLQALDLPFRVVYGQGAARLTNALLALGLPAPDEACQQLRAQAQFDLNRGRTPWSCEKCSDPECEHQLFTRLLQPAK